MGQKGGSHGLLISLILNAVRTNTFTTTKSQVINQSFKNHALQSHQNNASANDEVCLYVNNC